MKLLFVALLLLNVVTICSRPDTPDVTIVKDGEVLDVTKQELEGNLVVDGTLLKLDTGISQIETELLDTSVFAGAETLQEYDIESDPDEEVTIVVDGETDDQVIVIDGNGTDTNIEIDIDREGKESVLVEFEVDHEGEEYMITFDEGGDVREEFRVDEQELNVYIDENAGSNYVIVNDDIEIEVFVDIDDIDLDYEDYIDFDIGLYGEKDNITNDDIYIAGMYRNKKGQRKEGKQQFDDPYYSYDYDSDDLWGPENLLQQLDCSEEVLFDIPPYAVVRQGRKFEMSCPVSEQVQANLLSVEWVRVDPTTNTTKRVAADGNLVIQGTSCRDAAAYRCQVTYLCDNDVITAESGDLLLMVDNGLVLNPICRIFGDPHIITFDQKLYNFQGDCTYLLAMDANYAAWIIYGRFTQCGTGTCLEAVTVYSGHYGLELQRGWVINQNGRKLEIREGETLSPDPSLSVYFDGYEVFIELIDAQILLTWDGLMDFKIEVASEARTLGLCGNNNGDPHDDFTSWTGDVIANADEFGHTQAIDARGSCKTPVTVQSVGDEQAARAHCEQVLMSGVFQFASGYLEQQAEKRGSNSDLVRSESLVDACVFDYLAGLHVDTLSSQCYSGYNYLSICKRFGLCVPEGWQAEVGCIDKTHLQDLTVQQGCPYGDMPLPFNRT